MMVQLHRRDNDQKQPLSEIVGEHQCLRIATGTICVDIEERPDGKLQIVCVDGLTISPTSGNSIVIGRTP